MKHKLYRVVSLCVAILLLLSGCSIGNRSEKEIVLTEEQKDRIQRFVDVREKWETYEEGFNSYYINRVYVSEDEEGNTLVSVAYTKDSGLGYMAYVETGYKIDAERIVYTNADSHWLGGAITVDMETISDEQLGTVLRRSYKEYLSK